MILYNLKIYTESLYRPRHDHCTFIFYTGKLSMSVALSLGEGAPSNLDLPQVLITSITFRINDVYFQVLIQIYYSRTSINHSVPAVAVILSRSSYLLPYPAYPAITVKI